MKKLILLIALVGMNSGIYSQTKIGFTINDAFDVSGNSVAHYGMSRISGTGYHYVGLSGYFGVNFYTEGKERIKILRNGNVGIGTSNPIGDGLTIIGGDTGQDFLTLDRPNIGKFKFNASGHNTKITINSSNTDQFSVGYDTTKGGLAMTKDIGFSTHDHAFFIKNNGNVGIGTANPSAGLEVKNDNGIKVQSKKNGGWIGSIKMADGFTNTTSRDDMMFSTSGGFMFK